MNNKIDSVYVVTMYYFADRNGPSYVLGVYTTIEDAINKGLEEEDYRGGKFTCEVLEFILDTEKSINVILPLERENPLDLDKK